MTKNKIKLLDKKIEKMEEDVVIIEGKTEKMMWIKELKELAEKFVERYSSCKHIFQKLKNEIKTHEIVRHYCGPEVESWGPWGSLDGMNGLPASGI